MKKNYIICTPKLSGSNGVRVLHCLAKLIEDKGYNVFLYSVPNKKLPYKFITNITDDMRENDIIVYPDIIYGNPLKFRNVVRYILYYPNELTKYLVNNNYELPFVFERKYYEKGDILWIPGLDKSIFHKDERIKKDVDCYFVYKGGEWKHIPEFKNMIKITREYPKERKDLGDLLRRTKTLYSYDNCSLILEEALECGCKVKIVTEQGFEDYKSSYKENLKNFEEQFDNFIQKTQSLNYQGDIYKNSFKGIKPKKIISYFKYKLAHRILYPISIEKAQLCWFRAENQLKSHKKKDIKNV